MTLGGFTHIHVSEREGAHMSPCGYDDAKFEDCTPDSTLEWWRACGHPEVPATHAEAEALRCDAGQPPTGGTNLTEMRNGIAVRYKGFTNPEISTSVRIWAAMRPGTVAAVQGSMGAFPTGSPWRRWDPAFAGNHCVCAFRLDSLDRVWWCDPLAPPGWTGEWMGKADFFRFIQAFPGQALVAAIVPDKEADMFVSLLEKAEDWTPTGTTTSNGVFRESPDAAAPIVDRVGLGVVIRSTAEVKTSAATDNDWRVTMRLGKTLYMLRRDWNPVVPGGSAVVQAAYQSFVDGKSDGAIETARRNGYNAGVAAVQQQANSVKPI